LLLLGFLHLDLLEERGVSFFKLSVSVAKLLVVFLVGGL
jgi:hypothetical protein